MKKNKLPYYKESSFKVPEDYFETLEARVMENLTSMEEQGLPNKREESGFKVPNNYFENFEAQLTKKIEKEQKPSKVITLLSRKSFYYVAGAAAVFIALLTTDFFQPNQNENTSIETIELFAIENYINESLQYSTSDVLDMFEEGEFENSPPPEPNFDQEAILEYLNENIEETAIIFNEN